MPELSVIIVTYNSKTFIRPCLDSLGAQAVRDYEVIVVDNGSQDGTADFIKKEYPRVTLLENKSNLGAAKARNQGVARARGTWVLTLDCDIVLENDFFALLAAVSHTCGADIGMVQPKILSADKNTIYSCGIHLSRLRRFYDIGKGRADCAGFRASRKVFGVCSAAALYRRKMLEEIKEDTGYFDERFFFLVEDVDLAWRAQRRGWRAQFIPEAVCYHAGDSSGTPKGVRQYLCLRNRYFSIAKNEPAVPLFKTLCRAVQYDIPRLGYLLCTNRLTIRALRETAAFLRNQKRIRVEGKGGGAGLASAKGLS